MNRWINRRNFLRGLGGVAVSLPLLESLSRQAHAQTTTPKRFACFFNCNGVQMDRFFPVSDYGPLTSSSFTGRALEPISAFASKLLIPRGLYLTPRGYGRDGGAGDDHAKGMGHKLTAEFLQSSEDAYADGISVDQAIAAAINPAGRQALTLKVGSSRNGVLGHISYLAPGQPVTGENNPWLAYRDFMGLNAPDADPALERIAARRESVLDIVRQDFEDLQSANLSQADREKLERHYDNIRDLENGMSNAGLIACNLDPATASELEGIDPENVGNDSEFTTIGRLQMDVLALALACDYTRSATLQWGNGAGGPIYTWDGMSHQYNHHKLSHGTTQDNGGSDVPGYEDMLFDIDYWHMMQLAYLLEKLDSYAEPDGKTTLDNTVLLYANELSDGKAHSFMDLPFMIFGGADYFKLGEYVKVTSQNNTSNDVDSPHNKLLTMCMNAVGIPTTKFGGDLGESGEYDVLKA